MPIFIEYGGSWDEATKKFVGFKCKGTCIQNYSTYEGLLEEMYLQLEVDSSQFRIILKIDTSDPEFPFLELSSDEDIQFFICIAKKYMLFPLYVSMVCRDEDRQSESSEGSNHFPAKEQHMEIASQVDVIGEHNLERSQLQCNDHCIKSKEKVGLVGKELVQNDDQKKVEDRCRCSSNDDMQSIMEHGLINNGGGGSQEGLK